MCQPAECGAQYVPDLVFATMGAITRLRAKKVSIFCRCPARGLCCHSAVTSRFGRLKAGLWSICLAIAGTLSLFLGWHLQQFVPQGVCPMTPTDFARSSAFKPRTDVARDARATVGGRLGQVGMAGIEMPVLVAGGDGRMLLTPARVDAFVNLIDPEAKGIHMSRLFLAVQQALVDQELSPQAIEGVLSDFLRSHQDISDGAYVTISYDAMVLRPALKSANKGWRRYPVTISAKKVGQHVHLEQSVIVTYSSTCPCSASLARELIQQQFASDFANADQLSTSEVMAWLGESSSICATPHSQRSEAEVSVTHAPGAEAFDTLGLINYIEETLQTPVQAAVKREDEQEFARLNGQNLMFCEDACRRIQSALNKEDRFVDFAIEVRHLESLHPHDAVARSQKFQEP